MARKYKRKGFKKNRKTNQLSKRVKKLEIMTKNVVERNYRYNSFSMSSVTSSGMIKQDPFDLLGISTIQPPGSTAGFVNYGTRIGDRISVTRYNIQAKIQWADTNTTNTWCRVRVILFQLSNNTANNPPTGSDALVQDIVNLSEGSNVGATNAWYRKDGQVKYKILKDRTYTIGNKQTSQLSVGEIYNSQYPPVKYLNWTIKYKNGKNVEYDFTSQIRTGQLRLLVITENDSSTGAQIQPDIHFKTITNYIM